VQLDGFGTGNLLGLGIQAGFNGKIRFQLPVIGARLAGEIPCSGFESAPDRIG
jgi:hypothetical protein